MEAATSVDPYRGDVLSRLRDVSRERGATDVSARLAELRSWIADDLVEVEGVLAALDGPTTPAFRSARHLLDLGGKRLRPLCVLVASRFGTPSPAARDLAVAAELVHAATLLHDDVVDLGDKRRGAPAARVIYGNAASIFGGDWLLVEALGHVRRAGFPDLLDGALAVLREMLRAESFQLASRGRVDLTADDYFFVARGKTASLFRWALMAGARAAGLSDADSARLGAYGEDLGVAFQVVDDVLDVSGDPRVVGKTMLSDLREGKVTYPLLLALERDGRLATLVAEATRQGDGELPEDVRALVARRVHETGAVEDARALARSLTERAESALGPLPDGRAKDALVAVAGTIASRKE